MLSEVDRLISKKLLLDGRVHKKLKKRIFETLKHGAQGMFRWVAMSLETLQQIKFRQDFENRLGRLPSKLSGLYDIIYSEIIRSENDETIKYGRVAATKTLKWLLCAERLLTVEELAAAIQLPYDEAMDSSSASDDSEKMNDETNGQAIDSSSSSNDSNQKGIEVETWIEDNIIRLCHNLVVVDSERIRVDSEQTDSEERDSEQIYSERKVFRFAHQSVREYLLTRKEYTDKEQHALVVERCFEIYEVETSSVPAEPNLTRQNELLKPYARGYWPQHYKYLDDLGSQGSRMSFRKFMIQESERLSPYMQWVVDVKNSLGNEDKEIRRSLGLGLEDPLPVRLSYALAEPHTPLSMICAFGLSSMFNELDFLPVESNQPLKWNWRCAEMTMHYIEYEYTTPLSIASGEGHTQVVRRLLDKGATINVSDESCRPPLLAAIFKDNENIVQMLLENGADIKAKCNIDAWRVACGVASEHIVKLLFERGADVNALDSEGRSALVTASRWGREWIMRFLLEQKADINVMDLEGRNSLHCAAMGHLSVVRLLLEHEAEINARDNRGMTPLHYASNESIARVLIERGAEVNARNENNQTSLHFASTEGDESVVQLLLAQGADVNARDNQSMTPLHHASGSLFDIVSVVQLLLAQGADVNARDNRGMTPLHYASDKGFESIERVLIERGADVNVRDENNQTPLHYASDKGFESIARVLIEHGADVNARDENNQTPLHWAAIEGAESVLQLLLEQGADINARNCSGRISLHLAADMGNESAVRVFLDHGADINAHDDDGRTPLDLAREKYGHYIVSLLLQHGAIDDTTESEEEAGKENGRNQHSAEEQEKFQSGEESKDQGEERSKEKKDRPSEADKDEPDVRDDVAEA